MQPTIPGFRLTEKLYEQHHSLVYRAQRQRQNQPAVLKILNAAYPSPEKVAQFKREYQVTRQIDLPGVIKVYDLLNEYPYWVMVLEDFGGDSLTRLGLAGQIELANFLELAITVTDILGQLHRQQITHKDINPSNMVLNPITGQIKLIDFGISTVLSRESPSFRSPGLVEGTLAYISPEQTGRMNRPVDYRTDFYSLGVAFYELLTGQLPFASHQPLELLHSHLAKVPIPPHQVRPQIPPVISNLILKLMAKNAEDRYQSASGLRHDLEWCRQNLNVTALKDRSRFKLGQADFSERFQLSQKLYGRSQEIEILLSTFERVAAEEKGEAELLLVAGYSGVGKSSLVFETHKPITAKHGYFIWGKFDYLRQANTPYLALAQALSDLVRLLLTQESQLLDRQREQIQAAVNGVGRVLTELVPELELIIGPQPELPELEGAFVENRFHYAINGFIKAIARPEHPLVIFLDDLQWADLPTLKLLEALLADKSCRHLLLIGAYRDNEVGPAHPMLHSLEEIKRHKTPVQTLYLSNLGLEDVHDLVADTLKEQHRANVAQLAALIYPKTHGNAFFVGQFLRNLHQENLIWFEPLHGWQWDIAQIEAMDMSDNVVDLLVHRLQKLPAEAQHSLQLAACIGSRFDLSTLALVAEQDVTAANQSFHQAVLEGLIMPNHSQFQYLDQADLAGLEYRFIHDRVHQAAYTLIPPADRAPVHLKIGRLLKNRSPKELDQHLFEVVSHLNLGAAGLTDPSEKLELAQLNHQAAQKAIASAAFETAYNYLQTAIHILPPEAWSQHYQLTLSIYTHAAEAAYLCSDFAQMEHLAGLVLTHAQTSLDKVKIFDIKIMAYQAQTQPFEAVQAALQILAELGFTFPNQPQPEDIGRSLQVTMQLLTDKEVEALLNLPLMDAPDKQAALRLMSSVASAAYYAAPALLPLLTFEQVRLSITYGHIPHSSVAYALFGFILCGVVGDIPTGYRFGKLALKLLDHLHAEELKARVYLIVSNGVLHWKQPGQSVLGLLMAGYHSGLQSGDFHFAAQAIHAYCFSRYFNGGNLIKLEQNMAIYDEAIANINEKMSQNFHRIYWQSILNLIGEVDTPGRLCGQVYDEFVMLPYHHETKDRTAIAVLYLNKLMLTYLFGDYPQALENAAQTVTYLDSITALMHVPVFYFYDALARLAVYPEAPNSQRTELLTQVAANLEKLQTWAKFSPENRLHKYYLVKAEQARVLGQKTSAIEFYDWAIEAAKVSGYTNEEALARELAARFYLSIGATELAEFYLHRAWQIYRIWGAWAKVKHLEAAYPTYLPPLHPSAAPAAASTTTSSSTASSLLDVHSILKAAQVLSGEIQLDHLLEKLLHLVIENAGAERGLLIGQERGQLVVYAQANQVFSLGQGEPLHSSGQAPLSLINYVARTKQPLVLDDASADKAYVADPYIQAHQPKAVLCLPILHQGGLTGIIYLENNLTRGVFTPERLEVLSLIASQAAISLENARLYSNLDQKVAERTAEIEVANQTLKVSNAELDAFAHTVAHDLKNPLAVIASSSGYLVNSASDLDSAQLKEILVNLHSASQKAIDIVNELLLLASVRKEAIQTVPLDMRPIVAAATRRLAMMIQAYQGRIILPPSWPKAMGYVAWIEEVWVNYLSNGLKYGGVPPRLILGATPQPDGYIRFWVQDNGPGLAPEAQAQLFTEFTRLDPTRTNGHGLGLSIVRRIVEKLGGQVGVESTGKPNEGCTFYFTLPAANLSHQSL
jgi:predicted ATPase/signal transduction histidine kinase